VIEDVKPLASSAVETISNSDPTLIVEAAAALFLAYLLIPPVWSAISFNLRGYKGKQCLILSLPVSEFLLNVKVKPMKQTIVFLEKMSCRKGRILSSY